ncbi:MAG: hypothetical protein NTU73_07080 [Ignavibacteriae bacterium]|nr:hypothetical protein [Ignavibacteriota bacterium]
MKITAAVIIFICFTSFIFSQTPSFSVEFKLEEIMYHGDTCSSTYTISLERCKFYETEIKYTQDTSKIDWKNLPEDISRNMSCKEINNRKNNSYVTDYYYHNHDYAYENLIKINLYREKCGKLDTMVVNFPVKISSFVTMVKFGILYFYPGRFDLTDDMEYIKNNGYLNILPKENILPK